VLCTVKAVFNLGFACILDAILLLSRIHCCNSLVILGIPLFPRTLLTE
jgi:hypothetical protein